MKKQIAKLNPVNGFRNLCIAGSVTAATALPAWAAVIDTTEVQATFGEAKGDMSTIGGYIAAALVVLAAAALVFSMLRKA
ncbi:capsid protein [Stutzerimonas stutzeri]|uniref:Capsid protein n=1 Tax=Stutzerimonas stutzeri TaxID=316 RepID=A0A2S4AH43_STUST|nr:major capsid protein [Stutzerimonas stutzeri]MCQ4265523.1 major capsid protein [Stutzerimonas stutzeri]POH80798.1 capsid protein [Stutzerimonas stutzeri]